MNTSIIICSKKYDIGTRVVLWDESSGLNGYDTSTNVIRYEDRKTGKVKKEVVSGKRYNKRFFGSNSLEKLRKNVTQFFLHHSGLYHSADTFNVLHNQRGLSVTFILDDDGTLYQCLDVREKAWHGGANNKISVGIEIDSRAHAGKYPFAYDAVHQKKYKVGPRNIRQDFVQGVWINGFEYSDAQYKTLIRLGVCLTEIFPNISVDFPRNNKGKIMKGVIDEPLKYKGIICHYNTNRGKIDPISFDHYRLLNGIKKRNPDVAGTFLAETWEERQYALVKLGYDPGPVDGKFGPQTEKAVRRFQLEHNLVVDGIWGRITKLAVEEALGGSNGF